MYSLVSHFFPVSIQYLQCIHCLLHQTLEIFDECIYQVMPHATSGLYLQGRQKQGFNNLYTCTRAPPVWSFERVMVSVFLPIFRDYFHLKCWVVSLVKNVFHLFLVSLHLSLSLSLSNLVLGPRPLSILSI